MENTSMVGSKKNSCEIFQANTAVIARETERYLELVCPAYLVPREGVEKLLDPNSTLMLESMTYFRIKSCTVETAEEVFEAVNSKIEKLIIALHSIGTSISYGLISRRGQTSLVLGVYAKDKAESAKRIAQGMLSGVELEDYQPSFYDDKQRDQSFGLLSGVPSLYLNEEKQTFSLSSIMRSLNGQDYMLLFLAKPVPAGEAAQTISDLISVRDQAFAVSKRNVASSSSYSITFTEGASVGHGSNDAANIVGEAIGAIAPVAGGIIGTLVAPGAGTAAGIGAGTVVGSAIGGCLGNVIGAVVGQGKTRSEDYSASISDAITQGGSVSGDLQNGFALELMNYADKAIERLKSGQNSGVWQTAIAYSAPSAVTRDIIKACLRGELSKSDPDKLPLLAFEPSSQSGEILRIPDFLGSGRPNPLCICLNSTELGLMCTFPTEGVPDFELRTERELPLVRSKAEPDSVVIGAITDGRRPLENMPFSLSSLDLNKHVFVCGITGSGKTTSVKKILVESRCPFLVIESAKKEYRNLAVETVVYTLGKPEINCPQINPFYIQPGISPQTHIDYLKDLFNASFSFYGPMPYILEKCLSQVYQNKGWDLTLGYHPLLANDQSQVDFFNIEYMEKQYAKAAHRFLFPTMQELRDEIARYVEEDLKYDGEVAGNVKTAMKVRLENLCSGAKGFSFNTSECLDFDDLLNKNVVFELEGLADDSDKAFSVGLLVIFLNEYRQVAKERSGDQRVGLKHLLVIEEAHRLLKNVDTERTTETSGNPKGKAVEHFTNMIAEMRSYGQGVIVAEQIPSKLAPDVIKNSSTKIVQRIVSSDDQQIMANTIGLRLEDALRLGTLEPGYGLCHKEGMALPTSVKISNTFENLNGEKQALDVFVSDGALYNQNRSRFLDINLSNVRNALNGEEAKLLALGLLNTLLAESDEDGVLACDHVSGRIRSLLTQKDVTLTLCWDPRPIIARYLTEVLLGLITRGVYRVERLPSDEFVSTLKKTLSAPTPEGISRVRQDLSQLYGRDAAAFGIGSVAALIRRKYHIETDVKATIKGYFTVISTGTLNKIASALEGDDLR